MAAEADLVPCSCPSPPISPMDISVALRRRRRTQRCLSSSHVVKDPPKKGPNHPCRVETLPDETILEILTYLSPPEIVGFFNCSKYIRCRLDKEELWKGCWYWLAEEFSGAVTVHRHLKNIGCEAAFEWKLLLLLDWRFQQLDLSYDCIRSTAKEWCTRIREVGLVLGIPHTTEAVQKIHRLLALLKQLHARTTHIGSCDDEDVSTEDEYEHDKEWEMAMVAGMAFSAVRREVISLLQLGDVDIDRLPMYYETLFARFKGFHLDVPSSTPSSVRTVTSGF
eukprot:Sspe_Gene.100292::Locus_75011_Transcript_1_3_Confidence_0.500_Length_973::g.100292::m.100292